MAQFDKIWLLDSLRRLRSMRSVQALRGAIANFREQSPRDASSETIELDLDYVKGELDQIAAAQTLERARYYIERLIKSLTEIKTGAINDINLNRWKEYDHIYTDSLWVLERRDSSGVHTAGYWGNFIPQIPRQLMLRYTKKAEWVLDPFAGSGTTLIEGQRLGRNTVGIELQATAADLARRLVAAEPNTHGVVADIITGDSAAVEYGAILQRHGQRTAQLVILHPPYFDIIKFSDNPNDLSNAPSVEAFLEKMGLIVDRAAAALDPGRYLALVIGDKYRRGEWIPLGFMTMNEITRRGFMLKSIVVKNFEQTIGKRAQKELWRYRALAGGFYVFKHEYIFVFRKWPQSSLRPFSPQRHRDH
jgi:hypothetical protein